MIATSPETATDSPNQSFGSPSEARSFAFCTQEDPSYEDSYAAPETGESIVGVGKIAETILAGSAVETMGGHRAVGHAVRRSPVRNRRGPSRKTPRTGENFAAAVHYRRAVSATAD